MSYEFGKLLINQKKFKQALKHFQILLKNKKNDLRTNFQIGKIFYELNDLHITNDIYALDYIYDINKWEI